MRKYWLWLILWCRLFKCFSPFRLTSWRKNALILKDKNHWSLCRCRRKFFNRFYVAPVKGKSKLCHRPMVWVNLSLAATRWSLSASRARKTPSPRSCKTCCAWQCMRRRGWNLRMWFSSTFLISVRLNSRTGNYSTTLPSRSQIRRVSTRWWRRWRKRFKNQRPTHRQIKRSQPLPNRLKRPGRIKKSIRWLMLRLRIAPWFIESSRCSASSWSICMWRSRELKPVWLFTIRKIKPESRFSVFGRTSVW